VRDRLYLSRKIHSVLHLRDNLKILCPRFNKEKHPLLIFVNKGIEIGTHALTLEIIADACGAEVAKSATFIVSF
jgi:hypothetical protein